MHYFNLKKITKVLIIVLLFNFIMFGFIGNSQVEAGFWDNNRNTIVTFIKGVLMLWVMNLLNNNSSEEINDEDLLTSTIQDGLMNFNIIPEEENEQQIITEKEQVLLDLINKEREQQGISALEVDPVLMEIARTKAQDMIENNYFDHNSPVFGSPFEMMADKGVNYQLAGENLAGAKTVENAFNSLMNNPAHKENILDYRYNKIGIGVVEGGPYGLMVVQHFIKD